ncbi:MAG TPA: ABC transporter ATP-binding protein, partial [Clostridia bacterium]|nr:ABC transporter ATP-binding protein [Clostridia bacterium]
RLGMGLLQTVFVLVTAAFIDTALLALNEGKPFSTVLGPLAGVVFVFAWQLLHWPLTSLCDASITNGLRGKLRTGIMAKRAKLAYWHLENQESWDLIERVSLKPEEKWREMMGDILAGVTIVVQIVGVMVVLVTQVWWAGAVLLAAAVPLLRLSMRAGEKSYDAEREVTKIQRKYKYLGKVMTDRENVEERSLFGYTGAMNRTFQEQYEAARLKKHRVDRAGMIRMKAGGIACVLIALIVMFVLLQPVLAGTISVGMYMSLVIAIFNMVNMLSWGLGWQTKQWVKHRAFMKDMTAFAALSEEPDALCLPEPVALDCLEFRDVVFAYPGTEQRILNGLSFQIRRGEHIAFVGANGAGKTTLTKLILGLYAPDAGEILLNNRPLSEYTPQERKGLCAVVFQDFTRYQVTLKENLLLGDLNATDARLAEACDLSGLSGAVEKLPQGLDTPLGKLKEDGQDLSGGEWQRLAMARALVHPAPLRILDEPTAALDPIGESELYRQFERMSRGHSTLFISHRLGSTQLADRIYVLEGGRVVETGSHERLLAQGGLYTAMFESQR